jgi:hypothetical protein
MCMSSLRVILAAREREVLQRERRMEYLALKQRWQEELEPDEVSKPWVGTTVVLDDCCAVHSTNAPMTLTLPTI